MESAVPCMTTCTNTTNPNGKSLNQNLNGSSASMVLAPAVQSSAPSHSPGLSLSEMAEHIVVSSELLCTMLACPANSPAGHSHAGLIRCLLS